MPSVSKRAGRNWCGVTPCNKYWSFSLFSWGWKRAAVHTWWTFYAAVTYNGRCCFCIASYLEVFLLFCPHPSRCALPVWISALTYLQPPITHIKQQKLEAVFFLIVYPLEPFTHRSVTALNTSWVFKPVSLIIQQGNQSIIWSKALSSLWSACHSSITWWEHKGVRSLGKLEVCAGGGGGGGMGWRGLLPPLSLKLYLSPLSLFQTASGNVEAKVVCFYRRRDISHSLIQLADKHASEWSPNLTSNALFRCHMFPLKQWNVLDQCTWTCIKMALAPELIRFFQRGNIQKETETWKDIFWLPEIK